MLTDADFDMIDLANAARDAFNGVCSICDEALDPLDPKWAGESWGRTRLFDGTYRPTTAAEVVDAVGRVHPDLPYHVSCLDDAEAQR